jgi:hypothetical protein
MGHTKSKKELVLRKQQACFNNSCIENYKIIIILNSAWEKSFARTEFNKEAIAARGWCPLTRNLLDHPEIIATAEHLSNESKTASSSRQTSLSVASTLINYNNGLASTIMADILQTSIAKLFISKLETINKRASKH